MIKFKKSTMRTGVFETNSSSTHSLSIGELGENLLDDPRKNIPILNNKLVMQFGEFGWEEREYEDAFGKWVYICTLLMASEGDEKDTEGFIMLEDFAKRHGFDGVVCLTKDYGYIDHQSIYSLKYFLLNNGTDGISIDDFLLDPDVSVITGNDNC